MRKFYFKGMAYTDDEKVTTEDVSKELKEKIQYYTERPNVTFNVDEVEEVLNKDQAILLNKLLTLYAKQPDLTKHDKEMAHRMIGIIKS